MSVENRFCRKCGHMMSLRYIGKDREYSCQVCGSRIQVPYYNGDSPLPATVSVDTDAADKQADNSRSPVETTSSVRQEQLVFPMEADKKETPDGDNQPIRRGRGRPKGSKNKPK